MNEENTKLSRERWQKLQPSNDADARMLAEILSRKERHCLKQAKRDTLLICCAQMIVALMMLAMIGIVISINLILAGLLLVGYVAICNFMSVMLVLRHLKKTDTMWDRRKTV